MRISDRENLKVLVTGGAGFIGSNFIRFFLEKYPSVEVVNYDKLTYAGNLENLKDIENSSRYKFIKGDIADPVTVRDVFTVENFDIVVNFAAESHVDRSIQEAAPFIRTNITGTSILLEEARKRDIELFLHISTDEVYGSIEPPNKFSEKSPLNPGSPYAASKASADLICKGYWKSYDLPIIITRSSNNYGPYQFPEKLIPLMIKNAVKGMELPVYGEGQNVRDWIYVLDNCRAIVDVIEKGKPGEIYNVSAETEKKNIDVVRLICKILAGELDIKEEKLLELITFIEDPRGEAHDFRYSMNFEKLRKETGWEPQISFEEGLKTTVKWYINNEKWVEKVTSGDYQNYYKNFYGNS